MKKNLIMIAQVLVALLVATIAAQSVEPIWLSPTSVGTYAPEFPELGVWSNISVGAGSHYQKPIVVVDSKKTLWILAGATFPVYEYNVWNYDPNTDLYQWVVGPGSSTSDPRNPGELQIPSPSNHPGAVTMTLGTIDRNDNIWFMSTNNIAGEVWMFNTSSHYFTRMKGDGTESTPPVYGTLGQPGDDVSPGRTFGGCLVVDSQNNLWQIAGVTNNDGGAKNRVWHFNTTSYQWTFFGGNSSSNVDTRFGEDPLYGARVYQGCDIDVDDRVWLFGGMGADNYLFNDVWSYDTRTVQWRLEFGSSASKSAGAAVAAQDDFDPGNQPAAKMNPSFVDRLDGTLLHVGGKSGTNDIWLFNKTLKQWKLIYGDPWDPNLAGNLSDYRTPGSVMPGGRNLHGCARSLNTDGDVYMHGGQIEVSAAFNDIWLIPQDQCSVPSLNTCSSNARCIDAMIGYSCECNEGFVGDGFDCEAIPIAPVTPLAPPAEPSQSPSSSPTVTPVSSSQPSTSPRGNSLVARGVTLESSLFAVLSLAVLVVSF